MLRLLIVASSLVPGMAAARVIRTSECVVTIGDFCPVETVGGFGLIVFVLFFAGLPVRYMLRRHFDRMISNNPAYRPNELAIFFYRHAGKITLYSIFGAVALIIAQNS